MTKALHYILVHRHDDAMIDALAEDGIGYVPYFPLGGFTPLQTDELSQVVGEMGQTPQSARLGARTSACMSRQPV